MMQGTEACSLWGGRDAVRHLILLAMKRELSARQLRSQAVSSYAGFSTDVLGELLAGKRKLGRSLAFSLLAPLGIPIDETLRLSREELQAAGSSGICGELGGIGAGALRPDREILLSLGIRLRALRELDG